MPSALCILSIWGSCWILSQVVKRARAKGKKNLTTYHRLVFCMSVFNIVSDLAFSLANIPVPSRTPSALDAYGNRVSCNMQGFLGVLGLAVPGYNTAMAINFLLIIRYGKTDRWVSRHIEPWLHGLVIIPAFATAILCLFLKAFNFSGNRCFVAPEPFFCQKVKYIPCSRGASSKKVLYGIFGAQIITLFIILICSMGIIVCGVYRTEKKSMRWHFPRRSESVFNDAEKTRRRKTLNSNYRSYLQMRQSRAATRQASLYITSFLLCHSWSFIITIYSETRGNVPFVLYFCFYLFFPLRGFFNFLIFRSTTVKKKKSQSTEIEVSNNSLAVKRRVIQEQRQHYNRYHHGKGLVMKKLNKSSPASCVNDPKLVGIITAAQTRRVSFFDIQSTSLEKTQHLIADPTTAALSTRRYSEPSMMPYMSGSSGTKRRISYKGAQMLAMVAAATQDDDDDFMNEINKLDDTVEANDHN